MEVEAKTLVLDCSYQVLGIVSWQRAFTLLYEQKVEIVSEYFDLFVRSAKQTFKVPSIIRFIKKTLRGIRRINFSRSNLYLRDNSKCQYCTMDLDLKDITVDHVIPKSKGGRTCFENCVVCCVDCNRYKKDRTPEEAGMKLKNIPYKPKKLFQKFVWNESMPLDWQSFLYYNVTLESD